MNCIFNELSFADFVDCTLKLPLAFKELCDFTAVGRRYGHDTYIHREALYETIICGQKFRNAVNLHIESCEDKRKLFNLLSKRPPVLPDDTVIPTDCSFFHKGQELPPTGLAECAYRKYMNEPSLAYSLPSVNYSETPLQISFKDGVMVTVDLLNVISTDTLCHELERIEPPIRCWADIFQRATRLPHVCIERSARTSLEREPFEVSLGKAIWERLNTVEKIASSSGATYVELVTNNFHGDSAIFSDESRTRINDLGEKLYFLVGADKKLCSFHAKIRHRDFRIHMDIQPVPNKEIHIVYIGTKIL